MTQRFSASASRAGATGTFVRKAIHSSGEPVVARWNLNGGGNIAAKVHCTAPNVIHSAMEPARRGAASGQWNTE